MCNYGSLVYTFVATQSINHLLKQVLKILLLYILCNKLPILDNQESPRLAANQIINNKFRKKLAILYLISIKQGDFFCQIIDFHDVVL